MSAATTPDQATGPTAKPAPPSTTNAAARRVIGPAPMTRPCADGAMFEAHRGPRRSHPWTTSRVVDAPVLVDHGASLRRARQVPANPHDQQGRGEGLGATSHVDVL